MKKALRSILALLTALILACTGGPFRPVTSEAADSKAPYLRVTGITDQSLTVELVGDETDLFIKESRAALGGPLFGDVIPDLEEDDLLVIYMALENTFKE